MTAAPPTTPATGRSGRRLAAVCGALLLAGAALEGAARLAWFTGGVDAVGRGTVAVTARGADLVPALSAVALLAVAAVAAAVALAGPLRRVLGGLVLAAGSWIGVVVVELLLVPPTGADLAALPGAPAGATPLPDGPVRHAGPLVGVLGVALLLVAGIVLLSAEHRLPRLGARYSVRTGGGRTDGGRTGAGHAGDAPPDAGRTEAVDPDRAAWDALDAGHDPTADEPAADPPGIDHLPGGGVPGDHVAVDHPGAVRPGIARPSTDPGRTDGSGSDRAV